MEPLYSGHHGDPAVCPVHRGVPNSEICKFVDSFVVRTADSDLIREVSLIQSVLYGEVPLYICKS